MKITRSTLFFLLFFCLNSYAQVPPAGRDRDRSLADIVIAEPTNAIKSIGTYSKNGKYGFVSIDGQHLEAIYDYIGWSYDGFVLKKDGLFGIADISGKPIVKIEYDSIASPAYLFGDTYLVKKADKYGTLSKTGAVVLSAKYDKILFSDARNGISFIQQKNNPIQLILNANEQVNALQIDYAQPFRNLTILKSKGKFGVLRKGKLIVPLEYDSIFYSTPAKTSYPQNNMMKKKLVSFDGQHADRYADNVIVKKGEKFGIIDSLGQIIYTPELEEVKFEGAAAFLLNYYTVKKDKFLGAYFPGSKKKINIEYHQIYPDGIACIYLQKGTLKGAINRQGDMIIPVEYDALMWSSRGFEAGKNKKKGLIDHKGNIMVPILYDELSSFYEDGFKDFLKVTSNSKTGVVSLNNKVVIPAEFEGIGTVENFFLTVTAEPNRKIGLYDKKGKVVLPAKFINIRKSLAERSSLILLQRGENAYNFLNANAQLIFPDDVSAFGYVLDTDQLLNPESRNNQHLFYVRNKAGKYGLLNELTGKLDVAMVYDGIYQRFETSKHTYFTVKKNKKYGLINESGQAIIPFMYDALNIDMLQVDYNGDSDGSYLVVGAKGKKLGLINFKNEVKAPFQYVDLQRVSAMPLYKAKQKGAYQLIDGQGVVLNKGPFDEISNFERINSSQAAMGFLNGKMKVLNEKGKFVGAEKSMLPHNGYKTFDEMKFAFIRAMESPEDKLLEDFATKIAPSPQILYYLKEDVFTKRPLRYVDPVTIRERYYDELQRFKHTTIIDRSNNKQSNFEYSRKSLTDVVDYTLYNEGGYVTNFRSTDQAFGDRLFERIFRHALKVNGFWISSYFMHQSF